MCPSWQTSNQERRPLKFTYFCTERHEKAKRALLLFLTVSEDTAHWPLCGSQQQEWCRSWHCIHHLPRVLDLNSVLPHGPWLTRVRQALPLSAWSSRHPRDINCSGICLFSRTQTQRSMVPKPATPASPGNLLVKQIPRPHPRLSQSETLGMVPCSLYLNTPSRVSDAHSSLRRRRDSSSAHDIPFLGLTTLVPILRTR